jgi:hypothetical protein
MGSRAPGHPLWMAPVEAVASVYERGSTHAGAGYRRNTASCALLDQGPSRSLRVNQPNRLLLLRYSRTDTGDSSTRADEHCRRTFVFLLSHVSRFCGITIRCLAG